MVKIVDVAKTLIKHPVKSFTTGFKYVSNPPKPKNTISMVTPLAPAGAAAVSKVGSIAKSGWNALKTITTRKTINPAVGVSGAKNIIKTLGKAASVGATTFGIGYLGSEVVKTGITGKFPNIKNLIRGGTKSVTTGAGFGLSPVGGIFGLEKAGRSIVSDKATDFYNMLKGIKSPLPGNNNFIPDIRDMPNINATPTFKMPDINMTMPNMSVAFPAMTMPTMSMTMPSYSPSLSVGDSGLGSITPLLIAGLLGGGAIGYAVGRRRKKKRRKKKKYK